MKSIRTFVIAMLIAGVSVSFAKENKQEMRPKGRQGRAEVVAGKKKRMSPEAGKGRQDRRPGGQGRSQSRMLHIIKNPELCEQIGLSSEDREEISDAFKKWDQSVQEKRQALAKLQNRQARLIARRAPEKKVLSVVDQAWEVRAEIAKLQTLKLLKLRSKLTDEQIKEIGRLGKQKKRSRQRSARPPLCG